jgi:hypothetical protein
MRTLRMGCVLVLLAAAGPSAAIPLLGQPLRGVVYAADGSPAAGAIVWAGLRSPSIAVSSPLCRPNRRTAGSLFGIAYPFAPVVQ